MRVNKNILLSAGSISLTGKEDAFTFARLIKLANYLASMALLFAWVIAVGAIVFYGFQMAISKGDPGKFTTAKDSLIKAAIGAALILGVYTVIRTVAGVASSLTN